MEETALSKSIYEQLVDKIGHNYIENYKLIKWISEKYDIKSLPEEEYKKLDEILSACIQLAYFKRNLALDISEVDIKKYTLDSEYRGMFFKLEALIDLFKDAESGNVNSMMYLASAFHEGYFSPGLSKYAAKWCEKAAERGDINAMLSIASFYRWGDDGVFVNEDKAIYTGIEALKEL